MNAWQIFHRSFITHQGYKTVLVGLQNTLIIALVGLLIGIVIGTVIAVSKVIPKTNWAVKVWERVSDVYVTIFRGTPIVVQLLLVYYVITPALGMQVDGLTVAIVTFGLNSAAYVSEIMRSGIQSVDRGQLEAARSLGLSYPRAMLSVVLPQAVKNILPTLGNELIVLVKETSVVSFIAVVDITKAFQGIAAGNYEFIVPYCVLALVYLVITTAFAAVVNLLERRMKRSDSRN